MRQTKLQWLKNVRAHLRIPDDIEVWIWWDFISIPQKERNLQLRAIASLPYYANICSRFIPMVRDPEHWVRMYGTSEEDNLPSGTLAVYLSRGWCRLEIVAALCPKRFEGSGSWRPGSINMRYRYHHDPAHAGLGRRITAADLLDPREGTFYKEADKEAIAPVLRRIALEYEEYEESGATEWDTLIDVKARPAWLKALAIETRLKGLSTSVSIGKGAKGSMFDTSSGSASRGGGWRRPSLIAHTSGPASPSPAVRRAPPKSPTARLTARWAAVLPNTGNAARAAPGEGAQSRTAPPNEDDKEAPSEAPPEMAPVETFEKDAPENANQTETPPTPKQQKDALFEKAQEHNDERLVEWESVAKQERREQQ